jgi:hypothetical protein
MEILCFLPQQLDLTAFKPRPGAFAGMFAAACQSQSFSLPHDSPPGPAAEVVLLKF